MSVIPSPSGVVRATQLVNHLLATLEKARDIVMNSSNNKLKVVVSDLYGDVVDLKEQLLDQDDEIRRLKGILASKDQIVGPKGPHGYFYCKDDSVNPLCPRCVQQPSPILTCMGPALPKVGGLVRTCPICDFEVWEKPQDFGRATAIPSVQSTRSLLSGPEHIAITGAVQGVRMLRLVH